MLNLTNKQINYTVDYKNDKFQIYGTLLIAEDTINNLYGNIYKLGENMEDLGTFNYSENEGIYNESLSGAKLENKTDITTIVDELVAAIKAELVIE